MSDKTERSNSLKQAPKRRRITKWLIISISIIAVLFGAYELGRHNHLWGESDTLRAIKSEKLASEKLLGLTLINSKQQSGEVGLVQKTVPPSVTREFKVDPKDIDKTVKDIIVYAESDGWVHDPSLSGVNEWWGRKKVGEHDLAIAVRYYKNNVEVTIL